MKYLVFAFFIGLSFSISAAASQVILFADGPGTTYEKINSVLAPGYVAEETPDMTNGTHASFGRHIAEVFDSTLNRYVFEFYIHALIDNDVSTLETDRQRVEIKTYANSPANMIGNIGETMTFKWKFKLPTGFQPSTNFTHIHQIKAVGGDESSPLFTLTPRLSTPNQLQLIYVADSSTSSAYLATLNLSLFINTWVDVTEVVKVGDTGTYSILIKKVSDGSTLLSYSNSSIKTIRPSNSFIRPKWGIYRSLLDVADLRDDTIRLTDFSIQQICSCK